MKCVYEHRRADNLEAFYIGCGTESRARDFRNRSKEYKRYKKNLDTNGISTNIVFILKNGEKFMQDEDAERLEIKRISFWREKGVLLLNISSGGKSGGSGCSRNEETRKKMSIAKSGDKNYNYGKKGKDHHNFGIIRSEETRKKLSLSHTGKKLSDVSKKKVGESSSNRIKERWIKIKESGCKSLKEYSQLKEKEIEK